MTEPVVISDEIVASVAWELGQASQVFLGGPDAQRALAVAAINGYLKALEEEAAIHALELERLTPEMVADAFDVPVEELERLPLRGRRGTSLVDPKQEPHPRRHPMKAEVRLRGIAVFTAEDREKHPLLRDLEIAYQESPAHVGLPHKPLDGQTGRDARTVTYMRRADLDERITDRARRQHLAELMPDVDLELFESFGGLRG